MCGTLSAMHRLLLAKPFLLGSVLFPSSSLLSCLLSSQSVQGEGRGGAPYLKAEEDIDVLQVITVPVHFNDQQRMATAEAGASAGLQSLRLLHGTLSQSPSYHLSLKVRWNTA